MKYEGLHCVLDTQLLGRITSGALLSFGYATFSVVDGKVSEPDYRTWNIDPISCIDHGGLIDTYVFRDWLSDPERHAVLISTLNDHGCPIDVAIKNFVTSLDEQAPDFIWTSGSKEITVIDHWYKSCSSFDSEYTPLLKYKHRDYTTIVDLMSEQDRCNRDYLVAGSGKSLNFGCPSDVETELYIKYRNIRTVLESKNGV